MPTIEEQIAAIEEEMGRTQFNKATEHHLGHLRAKISKLRALAEKAAKSGGGRRGLRKAGDATVVIVGQPAVGKSALLAALAKVDTTSEAAGSEFAQGMLNYGGALIQVIDAPSLGTGADGELMSMARVADLILVVIDGCDPRPEPVLAALAEGKVAARQLIVACKADLCQGSTLQPGWIRVSAEAHTGLEELKKAIFDTLMLVRVYTKPRMGEIDWNRPLVLKAGGTVEDACKKLCKDWVDRFNYAQVWGTSAKFEGQRVGLEHRLADRDIVSFFLK